MRNRSIGPPWRIDPTTHLTMSSYLLNNCKDAIKECKQKFKHGSTEGNSWMLIAFLGLRLPEISDTVRKYLGNIMSPRWMLNLLKCVKYAWNRVRKIKGKETSNTLQHLSVNDNEVTSHRDIANSLADNFSHNFLFAFSTEVFESVRKKNWKADYKLLIW